MGLTYRAVNLVGRGVLAALGVDVRWTGAEHLPRTGPVLLAINHVSFPDFVLVERAAITRGRYVRFLTRADIWGPRPVAWAMDAMGHVPVDRDAPVSAYVRARGLLRAGEAVGIFPEAGISHAGTIRPLMRGAAALAGETGVPVVPVAVWGGQRIWSVGETRAFPDLTRGRRVDVAFGPPQYADPADDLTAWTVALGHTMTALLEGLQHLPEHQPRPGEVASWHPAHLGGHAPTTVEAAALDDVPTTAVKPTWGPGAGDAAGDARASR